MIEFGASYRAIASPCVTSSLAPLDKAKDGLYHMPDPNTYTPDWRVDVEPDQADDYDSTDTSRDADESDDGVQDDSESE